MAPGHYGWPPYLQTDHYRSYKRIVPDRRAIPDWLNDDGRLDADKFSHVIDDLQDQKDTPVTIGDLNRLLDQLEGLQKTKRTNDETAVLARLRKLYNKIHTESVLRPNVGRVVPDLSFLEQLAFETDYR